jgi:hypothetical protein
MGMCVCVCVPCKVPCVQGSGVRPEKHINKPTDQHTLDIGHGCGNRSPPPHASCPGEPAGPCTLYSVYAVEVNGREKCGGSSTDR